MNLPLFRLIPEDMGISTYIHTYVLPSVPREYQSPIRRGGRREEKDSHIHVRFLLCNP